jgi:DNA gyrase subunit A
LETGRGRIVIRARAEIEVYNGDRERIIVTEIPYQVNKALMIERTAELVNEKRWKVFQPSVMNQTGRGFALVYEIKRDANALSY